MNFKRITNIYDIDFKLTWDTYSLSFPDYEKRLLVSHKEALEDSSFYANAVYNNDDDDYIGFIFFWTIDSYIFIEHFAIEENFRNNSYGSKIIKKLIEDYKEYTLLLEIDPPEDKISRRRLGFYNRLGFINNDIIHCIPSFQKNLGKYTLNLLSHGRLITKEEYSVFYVSLMNSVFKYCE